MTKTFDEFIDKKRSKSPNRAYEHKYPQNLDLIKDLHKNIIVLIMISYIIKEGEKYSNCIMMKKDLK